MYRITVGDPQKIGDPISAHIVYTVHTKVRPLPFYSTLTHPLSVDHEPKLPQIGILGPTTVLRLPLAIRDVVQQQPGRDCTPYTREELPQSLPRSLRREPPACAQQMHSEDRESPGVVQ